VTTSFLIGITTAEWATFGFAPEAELFF
jgi:hypothetical protein